MPDVFIVKNEADFHQAKVEHCCQSLNLKAQSLRIFRRLNRYYQPHSTLAYAMDASLGVFF